MYGAYLYRLNYEEYKKNEIEMDEKIKQLSVESEDEEIEALEEAYIVRVDDEEFRINGNQYYLLLIGDHHFDADYIEDVLYGNEESYARYKELKKKEFKKLTIEEKEETIDLQSHFIAQEPDDESIFEDMVYEGDTEHGEMLKQVFQKNYFIIIRTYY